MEREAIMKIKYSDRFRSILILMVVIGLGFIAGFMWRGKRESPAASIQRENPEQDPDSSLVKLDAAAQKNIDLSVVPASITAIRQTIQTTGSVRPNETRIAHVRPLARGRIEKVYVRLGDRVRAGQPLIDYDNIELGELIGSYLSGTAALLKVVGEAEVSRRSLERAKNLVDLGAIARAEHDRREAEYKNALASIEAQKAEISKAEEKLHRFGLSESDITRLGGAGQTHREASHSILRAPFGGIVTKSDVAEGETADTDRELLTITDIATVWVQADLYEKDVSLVLEGQEARVSVDAYPDESFGGRITYISDFLDPSTRTAKVRCEVLNPDNRLKLDMFATVLIPTQTGRQALTVPSAAIQQINNRSVVFVKQGDAEFRKREVQLGSHSNGAVEIAAGLRAGELVVTRGSFSLKSELLRGQITGDER